MSLILAGAEEQARAVHEKVRNDEISREDAKAELDSIREETTAAIRELLTPEQAEVFDALKELVPAHGRPFRR